MADRFGRLLILVTSALGVAVPAPPTVIPGGAWLWIVAALLGVMAFLTALSTILVG